jgi:hypothetical protein
MIWLMCPWSLTDSLWITPAVCRIYSAMYQYKTPNRPTWGQKQISSDIIHDNDILCACAPVSAEVLVLRGFHCWVQSTKGSACIFPPRSNTTSDSLSSNWFCLFSQRQLIINNFFRNKIHMLTWSAISSGNSRTKTDCRTVWKRVSWNISQLTLCKTTVLLTTKPY